MADNKILSVGQLGSVWYDGRYWRRGITTGTCAAAAAKGAARCLVTGKIRQEEEVTLPGGLRLRLPLASSWVEGSSACCTVVKQGGDDPDITTGLKIAAKVTFIATPEIQIRGGEGVGTVTKPGLPIPPGEGAINPVPRQMIRENLEEILPLSLGAVVEISVPGGREAALKTMNPYLGIVGGISILGTSGIVEPMSEEAFRSSLAGRLSLLKAKCCKTAIFTPGRKGERIAAAKYSLPGEMTVQISNFAGYMLEQAVKEQFQQVLFIGHLGKMVKLSAGIFHTHSRIADGRLETMAAWLAASGAEGSLSAAVLKQPTTEAALAIIREAGFQHVFQLLAERAEEQCLRRIKGRLEKLGVVMTDWQGDPLGVSPGAHVIGKELGWCIPLK